MELLKMDEEMQEKKENLKELDQEEQSLKRRITTKQEKQAKLTMQHDYKMKDLRDQLSEITK